MSKYEKGKIYKARVTSIERYGVFASLDEEYSGLIHISELFDGFVKNINELVEIGDIINVRILDCSNKKNQLRLSAKDSGNDFTKNRKSGIKESVFGFYLLKLSLPGWISKKMKEIDKKS